MPSLAAKGAKQSAASPAVASPTAEESTDFGSNADQAAAIEGQGGQGGGATAAPDPSDQPSAPNAKADRGSSTPKVKASVSRVASGGGGGDAAVQKQKETLNRMQPAGPNATAIHDGWGVCDTETVVPTLKLKEDGDKFVVDSVDFLGNYSKIVTLTAGVTEVKGPGADTTEENYKKQMGDLRYIADDYTGVDPGGADEWYMLKAVEDHESVHESRLLPALSAVKDTLAGKFSSLSVAKEGNDESSALAAMKAMPDYASAVATFRDIWDNKYVELISGDHAALCPDAEHAVVDPMINAIDNWAKTEGPEKPPEEAPAEAPTEGTHEAEAHAAEAAAVVTPKDKAHEGSSTPKVKVSVGDVGSAGSSGSEPAVTKQKESLSRMVPAGPNATSIHSGWGVCDTETVVPTLKLKKSDDKYVVDSVDFLGNYSKIVTLISGVSEVGGPGVDTNAENYKKQMGDLRYVADDYTGERPPGKTQWYMLQAVEDHESVHEGRLLPALTAVKDVLAAKFTTLSVPATDTDETSALASIKAKSEYAAAVASLRDIWDNKYVELIGGDHAVLTPAAEHAVVDPMISAIDKWAKKDGPEKPTATAG